MTDAELLERLALLLDQVQVVIAERNDLRQQVKELQELTIDQAVEIGELQQRLGDR